MNSRTGARVGHALRPHPVPAALGLLLGLAVCLPWVGGRVFALDWVIGPHGPLLSRAAYGLDGGLTSSLPFLTGAALLERALGSAATWLPYLLFFPLATMSLSALARHLRTSLGAQLLGALLFAVNPWVLDRVAVGHLALLLGYALLPLLVLLLLRHQGGRWRSAVGVGLLLAVLIGLSPHYLWIGSVLVVFLGLVRPGRWRATVWSVGAYGVAAACSAYLLVEPLVATRQRTAPGTADLAAYRTWGDNSWRALGNVVGLQGFWRPIPQEPSHAVPAWPLLAVAVLLLALVGLASHWRAPGSRGQVSRALALAGGASLVLALGARGPLGGLYRALYDTVPLFRVMREPQKWAALLALSYSVGLALGVDALLAGTVGRRARAGAAAVVTVLILGFTPTLFWGVAGSMRTSTLPPSYARADAAMGDRSDGVLVLPWHLYLSFPYTQNRVVANPAPYFLRRDVLSGDVAELPGVPEQATTARSQHVSALIADGPVLHDAGARIAQLGVRYVALLHGGDWLSYGWLRHQKDLRPVFSSPEIDVWEVPPAQVPGRDCQVRRASPARYDASCSGADVVIPEAFDPGWRAAGARPYETAGGLVGFHVRPGAVTVTYEPAKWAGLLLGVSALALTLAVVMATRTVISATSLGGLRSR